MRALGGEEAANATSRSASPSGTPSGGAGAQRRPQPAQLLPGAREQDQRVRPDAAERRGEHAEQRLLVERVRERGEVGEAVADRLLGPVAAAADDVGRHALLLERLLEQPQRRGRADEHDDVARGPAGLELAPEPVGDHARLGAAVGLGLDAGEPEAVVLLPAAGVGDEQLDARLGVARLAGVEQAQLAAPVRRGAGQQRREALRPLGRERAVEHVEQLLAGAEVGGQRAHPPLPQRRPPLAEDRHVGVAEAVDRLELVADREQVVALEHLEHVELEPVRVLELVDHDQPEALGPALAAGGRRGVAGGGEQVADAELEVLEVEPGAGGLRLRVGGAEAGEQVGDLDQREPRVVVGAALAVGGPGLAVGRARLLLERLRALLELAGGERGGHRHAAACPARARTSRARRAPPPAAARCRRWRGSARPPRAPRRARRGRDPAPAAGPAAPAASRRASAAWSGRRARCRAARGRTRRRRRSPPARAPPPTPRRRARRRRARAARPRPRRAPRSAGRARRRAAASAAPARRSRGSCRSSPRRPRARAPPRPAPGSAGGSAPAARPRPSR